MSSDIEIDLPDELYLNVAALRDPGETSLVKVIGEHGEELRGVATGLRMIAFAIRGLPGWSEPDQ